MRKSIWHQKVEALYHRLPPAHPRFQEVKKELAKCNAGLEGEKRLFYFLSEINESYRILHDIRLPSANGTTHVQIDTIVICPSIIFLFEVKHISGTLLFNRYTNQLTRNDQVFGDPITQVQRQEHLFAEWLPKPMPILSAVVLSHPQAKVEFQPVDSPDLSYLLYPTNIRQRMEEKVKGRPAILSTEETYAFALKLSANHRPFDKDIFRVFQIQPADLLPGIHCPSCKKLTVVKMKRHWSCSRCQLHTKTAPVQALHDYTLLVGTAITNQKLRRFLNIESRSVSEKLLKKWREDSIGTTKGFVHMMKKPSS